MWQLFTRALAQWPSTQPTAILTLLQLTTQFISSVSDYEFSFKNWGFQIIYLLISLFLGLVGSGIFSGNAFFTVAIRDGHYPFRHSFYE